MLTISVGLLTQKLKSIKKNNTFKMRINYVLYKIILRKIQVICEDTNNGERKIQVVCEDTNNGEKVVCKDTNNGEKVVCEDTNNGEKVVCEDTNNGESVTVL
jgi:hypothetical protein